MGELTEGLTEAGRFDGRFDGRSAEGPSGVLTAAPTDIQTAALGCHPRLIGVGRERSSTTNNSFKSQHYGTSKRVLYP